jgi:hypothetical protein
MLVEESYQGKGSGEDSHYRSQDTDQYLRDNASLLVNCNTGQVNDLSDALLYDRQSICSDCVASNQRTLVSSESCILVDTFERS